MHLYPWLLLSARMLLRVSLTECGDDGGSPGRSQSGGRHAGKKGVHTKRISVRSTVDACVKIVRGGVWGGRGYGGWSCGRSPPPRAAPPLLGRQESWRQSIAQASRPAWPRWYEVGHGSRQLHPTAQLFTPRSASRSLQSWLSRSWEPCSSYSMPNWEDAALDVPLCFCERLDVGVDVGAVGAQTALRPRHHWTPGRLCENQTTDTRGCTLPNYPGHVVLPLTWTL